MENFNQKISKKNSKNLKFFVLSIILTTLILLGLNVVFEKTSKNTSEIINVNIQLPVVNSFEKINIDLEISATSAIVVEIDKENNEFIHFEKNKNQELPIASLTKLMTALIAFENNNIYQMSMPIVLSQEAISQTTASRHINLEKGKILSLKTLLNMLLIESSNGAAYAIAETMQKSAFLEIMNLKAKELDMKNTYFITSSGLDNQNNYNYSTVGDLVKLTKYIKQNYLEIFEITKKETYHVFDENDEFYYFIPENTNKLLFEDLSIIGGKTGWTPRAGQCLIVVFSHPEKDTYFVSIVLNSQDRFRDTRKIIESIYNGN